MFKGCKKRNRCLKYPCPDFDEDLSHRFRCIELNSDLYGINEAIDFINTDFRKYWDNKQEDSYKEIT